MTNKHLALQIRNSLQRYGIKADPDALFDVICESIAENIEDKKPTLRDQFAMHILPSLMLMWREPGYSETGAVAESYSIANMMMECRTIKGEN